MLAFMEVVIGVPNASNKVQLGDEVEILRVSSSLVC